MAVSPSPNPWCQRWCVILRARRNITASSRFRMNIVSCCAGMDRNGRSSMSGISRPTAACGDGRNPVGVAPSFVGLSPRYPRVVPTLGSNTKALWACRESCATQAHVRQTISPRPTALRLPAHKAPKPTSGTVSVQDQRSCVFQARVGTTLGKPHHHTAPQGANPTGVVSIMESPESVSPQLDPLTRPPSFLCPTSF